VKLALFDLDGTLIPNDSDHAFGEFLVHLGWADADGFRQRNDDFYADYRAGCLDMSAYVEFATSAWRQRPADELAWASARFLSEVVRPMLHPRALALVQQHRAAGDRLAVVTATNEFVARPIAACFGVEELIATNLERDAGGRVTGRIAGTAAFREGKVSRVMAWLAEHGLAMDDFSSTHFYSDSTNDLPLLERVSRPVATNPGPELERIARDRGWPVLSLFHP
jgi:HAD superfamily hydrolase (TIGR01490 family)